MTRRTIDIGLLWHSANSGNLGVGALTVANMALARQSALALGLEPRFTIIGMRDGMQSYLTSGEAAQFVVDTRSLLSPAGCWRIIGKQDCILDIGAGDSFADIYGWKRFFALWATKMIAIWRRVPLLLSPQTIGPFTRSPYKQMAGVALRSSTAVVARDRMSMDALHDLAPGARGVLAVDVAFALPFTDRRSERGGAKRRVGVNVSGLLFNEAVSGRNKFGLQVDYAVLMRRFISDLIARGDVEVHLVPHATSRERYDDDGYVADLLSAEFPDAIRTPDFVGPCEAKSYISSLDLLVAGRMHACIGAFSAGTPVVPVAYSRKFSGLFGLLDYPWMIPVTGMSTDQALAYLNDAVERRGELATDEAAGMLKVDGLLDAYRAELRAIFLAATGRGEASAND